MAEYCKVCNKKLGFMNGTSSLSKAYGREYFVCEKCYFKLNDVVLRPNIHSKVEFDEYLKNLDNVLESKGVPQNCYEFLREALIKNENHILEASRRKAVESVKGVTNVNTGIAEPKTNKLESIPTEVVKQQVTSERANYSESALALMEEELNHRKKSYIGKTCPYCKTAIAEADEVVICSECVMPHHKDCWIENQGCTTFGCLGTIQGVNQPFSPQSAQSSTILCAKCGTQNINANKFCLRCGNPISPHIQVVSQPFSPQSAQSSTILCAKCGTQNINANKFCLRCGNPISPHIQGLNQPFSPQNAQASTFYCTKCGIRNDSTNKFCLCCGNLI